MATTARRSSSFWEPTVTRRSLARRERQSTVPAKYELPGHRGLFRRHEGAVRRLRELPGCSGDGCEKPHLALGLCRKHYHQQWHSQRKIPVRCNGARTHSGHAACAARLFPVVRYHVVVGGSLVRLMAVRNCQNPLQRVQEAPPEDPLFGRWLQEAILARGLCVRHYAQKQYAANQSKFLPKQARRCQTDSTIRAVLFVSTARDALTNHP